MLKLDQNSTRFFFAGYQGEQQIHFFIIILIKILRGFYKFYLFDSNIKHFHVTVMIICLNDNSFTPLMVYLFHMKTIVRNHDFLSVVSLDCFFAWENSKIELSNQVGQLRNGQRLYHYILNGIVCIFCYLCMNTNVIFTLKYLFCMLIHQKR